MQHPPLSHHSRVKRGEPHLWDTAGRQRATDIILRTPDSPLAVVEVSSTYDQQLRRDMHNCQLFETEINASYEVGRHWVLHLQRGWEVPPIKERRLLAAREELRAREHDGRLRCAPWLFAWSSGEERSRVEIRGWDSRVPSSRQAGPTHLTAFLDSELIRKKRSKLITDSRTLDAPERQLYLFTSPTGPNAHIATTHMLELADGTFALPFDLDELWLDSRGATLRRFRRQDGWTEYIL